MPAYTSTPGKSSAVQAFGGKVTKKKKGVALGPAPATVQPISGGTAHASTPTKVKKAAGPRVSPQEQAHRTFKRERKKREREFKRARPERVKRFAMKAAERKPIKLGLVEKASVNAILGGGKGKPAPAPEITVAKQKRVATKLKKAARKSQGGLARKLDRPFGPNETISPREAAVIAESEGLPGKTYAQIGKGESGLRPGAANPDDGYKSLWQMTPSVQSSETRAKWDQIAASHKGGSTNPIVAAKQAKVLAGSGTGVSNYYGTGFVTDSNAHLRGGQKRARKILYGEPKPIPKPLKRRAAKVLGKDAAKKIVKQAKASETKPSLNVAEMYYDPGINLRDNAAAEAVGGHGSHVHVASENPRDIVRMAKKAKAMGLRVAENKAFENVDSVHSGGSFHYREFETVGKGVSRKIKKAGGDPTAPLGQALDISGDAAAMAEFNEWVAEQAGGSGMAAAGMGAAGGVATGGSTPTGGSTEPGTLAGPARRAQNKDARRRKQILKQIIARSPAAPVTPVRVPVRIPSKTSTRVALGL